jgi:hypothetical protein
VNTGVEEHGKRHRAPVTFSRHRVLRLHTYRGSPNTDLLLLAASIRRYGGICGSAPVFEKAAALHVELLPYRDVQDLTDFPFAQKALAVLRIDPSNINHY